MTTKDVVEAKGLDKPDACNAPRGTTANPTHTASHTSTNEYARSANAKWSGARGRAGRSART